MERPRYFGTITLVDEASRPVGTTVLAANIPERELVLAIGRWKQWGAAGGYVRDEDGNLLAWR